jgi:hypothetical protein
VPINEAVRCPGCGQQMTQVADHGVRFQCGCGGRMIGLAPFKHLLDEGVGARVYVAATEPDPAVTCPFCQRGLSRPPASAEGPPGVAVCRLCEQVWLPADAGDWMAGHAFRAAAAEAPAAEPSRCEGCGAPWAPDSEGRCRYCRAQLSTPQPVLVVMAPPRPAVDGVVGGLTEAIATILRS